MEIAIAFLALIVLYGAGLLVRIVRWRGRFARTACEVLAICLFVSGTAEAQTTTRINVSSSGVQANHNSYVTAMSADGRFVLFTSNATNLVDGDTRPGLFLHDRQTATTTRVGFDTGVALSGDGRFSVFASSASDLVPNDTNSKSDIFVLDRSTGTTTRVSVSSTGQQANDHSYGPTISGDGRIVAFSSTATNLVPGDTNGRIDVFVHDRTTGTTSRISVSSSGAQANNYSEKPRLSWDGRFVVFESTANNLVPGSPTNWYGIYLRDRQTSTTTRVDVGVDEPTIDISAYPSISSDGRFVAFRSGVPTIVPSDTNGLIDVFVRDMQTGTTSRINLTTSGDQVTGIITTDHPWISGNGQFVTYWSLAPGLVSGDTNGVSDIFVYDRQTATTARASVATGGGQSNGPSFGPSFLSSDGRFVAYSSSATNLVPDDTNGFTDVFVTERWVRPFLGRYKLRPFAFEGRYINPCLIPAARPYMPWLPECPPPPCPECTFSIDQRLKDAPEYRSILYPDILVLLSKAGAAESHAPTVARLMKNIGAIPEGRYYSPALKASLLKTLGESRGSGRIAGTTSTKLVEAINAIELDRLVLAPGTRAVGSGKYSAIDLNGIGWMGFRDVERAGNVTMAIESGLPAAIEGFQAGWPVVTYKLSFTGSIAKGGFVDVSFYIRGTTFDEPYTALQILEWDGKDYANVTIGFDSRRGIITGRARSPSSTFVIVKPTSEFMALEQIRSRFFQESSR